jgi:hypothetical protein
VLVRKPIDALLALILLLALLTHALVNAAARSCHSESLLVGGSVALASAAAVHSSDLTASSTSLGTLVTAPPHAA